MAKPLWFIVSNCFCVLFESIRFNEICKEFKPVFYRGFVDNFFLLLKSETKVIYFYNISVINIQILVIGCWRR